MQIIGYLCFNLILSSTGRLFANLRSKILGLRNGIAGLRSKIADIQSLIVGL
jgi:hypothetical protein